ncbi:MAG: A/G-specific adenine glycosylase [Verrucomicrobiota bacterium]
MIAPTGGILAEFPGVRKINAIVKELLKWYAKNARDLPWRRTTDPYWIYVSEIMLQQTQVKTVIPFWERWRRELPTIEAAAKASPDKLHKLWEGLGYYARVRNLQQAAQVIVAQHGGVFPRLFDQVLALPGIGRYTAGAICSIAFDQPVPILDGNVIRVLTRIFGIAENPKEKAANARLWRLAEDLVLRAAALDLGKESKSKSRTGTRMRTRTMDHGCSHLNQSLMELGALVCTPRNAKCQICPVKRMCVAFQEDRVEALPKLGERAPATARRFVAFVMERDGKFLVRQRPAGVVNAHLWEFPNVEIQGSRDGAQAGFKSSFGFAARAISPLATVRHSITRYRVTLEAFRVDAGATAVSGSGAAWKTPAQMHQLAFSSAHRKILRVLGASKPESSQKLPTQRRQGARAQRFQSLGLNLWASPL